MSWLLSALQYGDSAYPAGAFAHSWGLETAVAEGHVRDVATLAGACRALLLHQVAQTDAIAAAACCRISVEENLSRGCNVPATAPGSAGVSP
ncbi:MAG: urease accessory protein UreF, partial [Dehalococcoidia bacterium]